MTFAPVCIGGRRRYAFVPCHCCWGPSHASQAAKVPGLIHVGTGVEASCRQILLRATAQQTAALSKIGAPGGGGAAEGDHGLLQRQLVQDALAQELHVPQPQAPARPHAHLPHPPDQSPPATCSAGDPGRAQHARTAQNGRLQANGPGGKLVLTAGSSTCAEDCRKTCCPITWKGSLWRPCAYWDVPGRSSPCRRPRCGRCCTACQPDRTGAGPPAAPRSGCAGAAAPVPVRAACSRCSARPAPAGAAARMHIIAVTKRLQTSRRCYNSGPSCQHPGAEGRQSAYGFKAHASCRQSLEG